MDDPCDEWARWLREDQEREAASEAMAQHSSDECDMEDHPLWGIF